LFQSREVAEAWRRGEAEREAFMAEASALMLDLAGLRPGSRVLDVAAGTGAQTLPAARRVEPGGSVLATDISASMLEQAAQATAVAGLTNVETLVADAQRLDIEPDSFDAAISRMGLMLMPDVGRALRAIRRVLKPGGKLAAIVFSTAEKNPYMAVPQQVVRRRTGLPPMAPGEPGMFALGGPGIFETVLREAGFVGVAIHAVSNRRAFASLEEGLLRLRDTSPTLRERLANLNEAEQAEVWAEIERELRPYAGPSGFEAAGEALVGVGTKPS
jgi:SAM-dependent methyltransferase